MKITTFLVLSLLTLSSFGLEIQCNTEWENIDLVVKTSESSGVTYILFLKGDELDKYWRLPDGSFESSDSSFSFKDGETSLEITVGAEGILKSTPALYNDAEEIKLSSCLPF